MSFDDFLRKDRPNKMPQITPSRLVAGFTRTSGALIAHVSVGTGWPAQARFWLEWGQVDCSTECSRRSFAFSRGPLRLDLYASLTAGCVVAKAVHCQSSGRSNNPCFTGLR